MPLVCMPSDGNSVHQHLQTTNKITVNCESAKTETIIVVPFKQLGHAALTTKQSKILLDQTQIVNLQSIAHHANAWCRCTNLGVHKACKAAYTQMHCSRTHTKHQEPTLQVDICTVQQSS